MRPDSPKYNVGETYYITMERIRQEAGMLYQLSSAIQSKKLPTKPKNVGIYPCPYSSAPQKEKSMSITRMNILALLALVQNDTASSDDLLSGVNGEGVFAEAIKKAEAERKEEALKALTATAKTIQTSVAEQKTELRTAIRQLREREREHQAKLNEIDAAAALLGGNSPNPFPLLRVLGLVSANDAGLTHEEWKKLTAIPTAG